MTQAQTQKDIVRVEVPIREGRLDPRTLDEAWRVTVALVKGNAIPGGCNSTEEVLIAVLAGMDVGLSPLQAVQNIMVVRKRPTIWGDAMLGLVEQSAKMDDIEETIEGEGDKRMATCRVEKKGRKTPVVRTFSVAQAKVAGLWGKDTWKNYPDRMLQLRARAFALRDAFPEVLKGLRMAEEMQDAASAEESRRSVTATAVVESLPGLPPGEAETRDFIDVDPALSDEAAEAALPAGGVAALSEASEGAGEPNAAEGTQAPVEPWGEPPKRNAAQHPAYWRAKIVAAADKWLDTATEVPVLTNGRALLARLDDVEGSPPVGVPHTEATPWFKRWADKAEAGEIDWRKYL